eukprot:NODE_943_length_2861_cov_0.133961.p2 type:complete len:250 gc:universal NODE_943_length_2861_cov_0.133961:1287-538(-)
MGRVALIKKISKDIETTAVDTKDDSVETEKQEETIAIEQQERIIESEIKELDHLVEKNFQLNNTAKSLEKLAFTEADYQAFRVTDFEESAIPVAKYKKNKKVDPISNFKNIKKQTIIKPSDKKAAVVDTGLSKALRSKKVEVIEVLQLPNPFTFVESIPNTLLDDPKFAGLIQEIVQLWQQEYRKRVNIETRLKNKSKEHQDGYVKLLENMVEEWMLRYESERLRQNQLVILSKDFDLLSALTDKFKFK